MKVKLLIVSMSVYPENVAMGLLVHYLANTLSETIEVTVCGQHPQYSKEWDGKPNYETVTFNPLVLPTAKGQRYHKWLSFSRTKRMLIELGKSRQITHILCCFPDELHMATAQAAAQQLGIPFYPWFHNTYLENRSGILKLIARQLQPKILQSASKLFAISAGLANYYQQTYQQFDCHTIFHGFPGRIPPDSPPIQDKVIRFAMTGSLNDSCLDAATRLARVITREAQFQLHIFGKSNAKKLGHQGIDLSNAIIHGFLPDDTFNARLADCDIMLLPHGLTGNRSDVEYQTIFPTRTIPLLSTARPILAHSPRGVFFTDFLQKHDCALVIDSPDETAISVAIHTLINDAKVRERLVKNALDAAQAYDVKNVAKQLISDLLQD